MNPGSIPDYIWAALCSAFIVGFAVYFADNASPYWAGFLAAFPTVLVSLIFINKTTVTETSRTFALGMLTYGVFAALFYSLIAQNGWSRNNAVYFCVTGWMLTVAAIWMLAR